MLVEWVRQVFWPPLGFKVLNCDLERSVSSRVSWKMQSSGKRSLLRLDRLIERFHLDAVISPAHGRV